MSVQTTECTVCGTAFEYGYQPGYCSEACYYRKQGEKLLNLLKHDHRFCHSDFAKIKEVQRPTDNQLRHIEGQHSTEAVIGFQYRTEHATTGETTRQHREDRKEVVGTGIVCAECGTADHRDDFQRDFEPIEAAKRLRRRVQETRNEGQHDWHFDTEAFIEAWNNHVGDWAYALGRAIANYD